MVDPQEYRITPAASEAEFLAVARVYSRSVVDEHDLDVDVSGLTWEVSTRAKRRAGAVKYRDDEPVAVSLTWDYFEEFGWSDVAETIRHELVHAHLLNSRGDSSHGEAFERLAEELDTSVHCKRFTTPKYWVVCDNCETQIARYRRSKLVTQPESYRCGSCGRSLRSVRNNDVVGHSSSPGGY